MKTLLAAAAILAIVVPAAPAALELPKRSVSSSKQFIVYATDATTRANVSIQAEDLKREFLELLRTRDDWKLPIVLQIGATPPNTKRPPRYRLNVYEGDESGNKVQLDVYDLGLLKEPEFKTQLLAAILLERAYRTTPIKAGRTVEPPPPWILQGLAEHFTSRTNSGETAGIYNALLSQSAPPKLAQFLGVRSERLDSTSLALYRAQASALVDAILSLPDGRTGLLTYLSQPRRSPGSLNELVASFPSMAGDARILNRRWVLAIARASAANRANLLSERETAKELETILAVKALPDPKRLELASMSGPFAFEAIARSESGAFILGQTESALLGLSLRAHPLYKSLVDEYLAIVRQLIRKPKKKVDKRVATAEEIRAGLTRQTSESRDYIDWVEATKIKTADPRTTENLDNIEELTTPEPRNDAISRYLDAVSERGF